MAENLPDLGARIELDIEQYIRNLRTAVNQADALDSALKDIVNQANLAAKALNGISGSSAVKLNVDTSAIETAKRLADDLTANTTFKADVDDTELKTAVSLQDKLEDNTLFKAAVNDSELKAGLGLRDLLEEDTTLTAGVNATAIRTALSLADDLNQTTTIKVDVDDGPLTAAKRKVDDLDDNVDVKIDANTEILSDIRNELGLIKEQAVIDLVLNAGELVAGIQNLPFLSTIIETDNAIGELNARVREDIPGAGKIINDVYVQAFGESRQQVAEVIAELSNAGVPIGELADSAMAAFTAADLGGEDVINVVQRLSNVTRAGLAPSFRDATDIYVAGIKNGLNTSDDLLDTLEEYSIHFKGLGVDANGFVSILSAGMEAGSRDTDKIADSLKELNLRVREGLDAGEGNAKFDALAALGMVDEAEATRAGEMSGNAFVYGLVQAASEGIAAGTFTELQFIELFGTQAEDLTLSVALALDPNEEIDTSGATADAAADLYDDLGTGLEGFIRIVETELATAIDEAFDITGFINDLKTGISEFSSLIADGVELDVAFDQAFGLEGSFLRFESAVADFAFGVLELTAGIFDFIAGVQDFTGRGEAATETRAKAADIRVQIADLATGQFDFDIASAVNEDDISLALSRATSRGVENTDITSSLTTAFDNAIGSGDFQLAAQIASAAEGDLNKGEGVFGDFVYELINAANEQLTSALASGDSTTANAIAESLLEIDPQALKQAQIDPEDFSFVSDAVQSFVDSGEFQNAFDLASMFDKALGDTELTDTLTTGLQSLLSETTSDVEAFDIANALNENVSDIANDPNFQAAFTSLQEAMKNQFEVALSSGDFDVATQIAERVGNRDMWNGLTAGANEAVIIVSNEFTKLVSDAANAESQTVGSMGNVAGAMTGVGLAAERKIPTAQNLLIQFAIQSKQPIDDLQLSLNTVLNTINAIADAPNAANAANGAAQRATGGGGETPGFASGGTFSGLGRVHADELLMAAPPGQEISVLNAQTSNVVMDAVAAVLGGMNLSGGSTNNKTVNQNIVFNTQSTAEDISGLNATSAAMRGF